LTFHHKYSIKDIENMYPFERDIILEKINEFLKTKEEENNK